MNSLARPPSERVRRILDNAEEMDRLAQLTKDHIEHRRAMTAHRRRLADEAFMEKVAKNDDEFWNLIRRAFTYAHDSMLLGAELVSEADALQKDPGPGHQRPVARGE
jgi:hypothetical protein